jgi:hypothetical protein
VNQVFSSCAVGEGGAEWGSDVALLRVVGAQSVKGRASEWKNSGNGDKPQRDAHKHPPTNTIENVKGTNNVTKKWLDRFYTVD